MATIFLPTQAVSKEDVEIMLGLLERVVGSKGIGLEIRGTPEHFQKQEYLEMIEENISSVAAGVPTVVHGFSGIDVYESGLADMRTKQGKCLLETYIQLAKSVRADYVHVHSGAGYKGNDMAKDKKLNELRKVKQTLALCESAASCGVGIENLPRPSMGDVETDPAKVWRDCVDSIDDLLYVVRGTGLFVTLDTCHQACWTYQWKINIVEDAKQLAPYLAHLHISDSTGNWPSTVWKEGVIPGEGKIGKEGFKEFFAYIREEHPAIGICAEVYNKDFKNPVESEESLKRIVGWLEAKK